MAIIHELEAYGIKVTSDPTFDAMRYLCAVPAWRIDNVLQRHPNLIPKVADQAEAVRAMAPVLWAKVMQ